MCVYMFEKEKKCMLHETKAIQNVHFAFSVFARYCRIYKYMVTNGCFRP